MEDECDAPHLYYGTTVSSGNMGPKPDNIRMTELRCHPGIKDFNIKVKS